MANIPVRDEDEVQGIARACGVVSEVLEHLARHVKAGVTTGELDRIARDRIAEEGAVSAFKGYRGTYPGYICTSVNEEVVHGIPGARALRDGDLVSVDVGVILGGFCGDAAYTFPVGKVAKEKMKLMHVAEEALYRGIAAAAAENRISDISRAIQEFAESNGMSVVRDYVGHGIGRKLHEPPEVPNYVDTSRDAILASGMTMCLEPMVNLGRCGVKVLRDGWTVVTSDRKCSAHYEHTIVVTEAGGRALTAHPVQRA